MARRTLKFRVTKEGNTARAVEEYCQSVGVDPKDIQHALSQMTIALKRLMPGRGVKQLKWVCLHYFLAGLHLGRTRPEEAKRFENKQEKPFYVG